ncbi:hypothetical protein J14TS2_03010 [Bacillus sp. J14TS2]|nr:hypothetical protein J14TS2_03010 [Bacillus sp. J14TS2]
MKVNKRIQTIIAGIIGPIKSWIRSDKTAIGIVTPSEEGMGIIKRKTPIKDGIKNNKKLPNEKVFLIKTFTFHIYKFTCLF